MSNLRSRQTTHASRREDVYMGYEYATSTLCASPVTIKSGTLPRHGPWSRKEGTWYRVTDLIPFSPLSSIIVVLTIASDDFCFSYNMKTIKLVKLSWRRAYPYLRVAIDTHTPKIRRRESMLRLNGRYGENIDNLEVLESYVSSSRVNSTPGVRRRSALHIDDHVLTMDCRSWKQIIEVSSYRKTRLCHHRFRLLHREPVVPRQDYFRFERTDALIEYLRRRECFQILDRRFRMSRNVNRAGDSNVEGR